MDMVKRAENLLIFDHVVVATHERHTIKQRDKQTHRRADCNTSYSYE